MEWMYTQHSSILCWSPWSFPLLPSTSSSSFNVSGIFVKERSFLLLYLINSTRIRRWLFWASIWSLSYFIFLWHRPSFLSFFLFSSLLSYKIHGQFQPSCHKDQLSCENWIYVFSIIYCIYACNSFLFCPKIF